MTRDELTRGPLRVQQQGPRAAPSRAGPTSTLRPSCWPAALHPRDLVPFIEGHPGGDTSFQTDHCDVIGQRGLCMGRVRRARGPERSRPAQARAANLRGAVTGGAPGDVTPSARAPRGHETLQRGMAGRGQPLPAAARTGAGCTHPHPPPVTPRRTSPSCAWARGKPSGTCWGRPGALGPVGK